FISYSNGQVYPYGIHILNDGGRFYSFNSTAIGTLNIHELGTRLSSPTITFKGSFPLNSGTISGIDLIKKGSSWFGFGPVESLNILNTLTFRDTCSATPASDTTTGGATVTYSAAGNYLASLSFTDSAGNTGFASLPVQVNPLPEVASTITGSCFGDSFSFSDLSTLSSGSLAGTVWSYGDGDSALTATAVHVYPDTGLFDVRMISFTAAGCSAALDTQIYVAPIPVASFSVNGACSESRLPISDLSTVATGSLVDWRWEFGNGDTLSGYSPDYSYPAGGSYQIALTVTSDAGCTDRDTMSVNIAERPDGRFSSSNTCVNQPVQFIDLSGSSSSVITDRLWSFGDGDTSSAVNPTHIYPSIAGNYPLQLVVTAANGCTDTVFQDLRISNPPTVSFTVSSTSICERNDVLFTDLSTVAGDTVAAWYWDFGDGRTSTLESPVHRYDTAGTYTVTLIAYSPTNCPGVPYQTNVTVLESPVAGFSTGNTCLGTPVTFTDTSLLPIGASLGSIRWDFGNGDTSTALQPSITYSVSGVYVVTQTTVTTDGCTDTDTFSLRVYEPPAASFSNGLPCSGQPVQFSNTSTTDSWSSIATSSWDFGDPASGSANNSSVDDPSHVFSGTSTYTVQLIVTSNRGCSDTVARTISPLPIAPATFSYSPTCFGDLMEFFNPGSSLDSMYSWQFGDNQTSFLPEPAHFYSLPGTYTVTLSVIAVSGCVSTATRPVTVSPVPVAAFSVGTACIGSPLVLTDQTQLSSGSIVNRNWWAEGQGIIGTGTVAQVTYPDTGQYLIRLTVTSDIGCTDSISQDVTVHPLPFASFSFDPQFGNPPLSVDFDNLSTGASTYSWDFGDGSSMNTAEPSHVFQDSGLYSIRLVAKSTFGCVDTVEKSIYVVRPVLDIAVTGDSSFRTGNYFHIVARLSNLGTRDIDRVTIEAQLEDGSVIREKLVRLIP
ncbi:MAG: hypothetical protein RL021_2237, partial [Bacteroidota bacterium]